VNRPAIYTTLIVLAHLLINVAHGAAHRELQVGLTSFQSAFVLLVILLAPLIALTLVWTKWKRLGLILLSASMFASFLFGLYHHFLVASPDYIHAQPPIPWGLTFTFTAYGLLITEAIGTYTGIHFLRFATTQRAVSL
jgi:hypothetical protein